MTPFLNFSEIWFEVGARFAIRRLALAGRRLALKGRSFSRAVALLPSRPALAAGVRFVGDPMTLPATSLIRAPGKRQQGNIPCLFDGA